MRDPWRPYEPTPDAPWNLRRVVRLHRRAGFAATWTELQRDLRDGPHASVGRVLAGAARIDGLKAGFDRRARMLGDAVAQRGARASRLRIQAWWVYRMLFGPDALGERLTLMWHGHFPTSIEKVGDPSPMVRQNRAMRHHACAGFGALLGEILRDPAMLEYLDANSNVKRHPNENLARELLELFTIGLGHFDEADVRETARALTGSGFDEDGFVFRAGQHDDGAKTILGETGRWRGDDVARILSNHPATARSIAARIASVFTPAVGDDAIEALAAGLRARALDIRWAVETVLRSRAFHADPNAPVRVLTPPEFVVGAVRMLEPFGRPPRTAVLAHWITRLGQDLFYPPNVGGWPGGRAWLATRFAIARMNFVRALVEGDLLRGAPHDPLALAKRHGAADPVRFHADLVLGGEPAPGWCERVLDEAKSPVRAVTMILGSPEAQLC